MHTYKRIEVTGKTTALKTGETGRFIKSQITWSRELSWI